MAGYFDFNRPMGGLWGMPDQGQTMLPDYMSGINQTLAANAQMTPPKPGFFDSGGMGVNMLQGAIEGIGDMAAKRVGLEPPNATRREHDRQLEEDQARYEARQAAEFAQRMAWKNIEDAAYRPNEVKDADYYNRNGNPQAAEDILAKATMVPVQRADPVTGEVRYEYVRPSQMTSGGGADLPTPKTAAEAAALPPGTKFRAPDGSIRRVPGGASPSNGSGGFQF